MGYAYENKTTCRQILEIQHKQLEQWKAILKPEVFQRVKTDIENRTERVSEADMDLPFWRGKFDERYEIPRGTYIQEAVSRQMPVDIVT
jgi:hypothetical protein